MKAVVLLLAVLAVTSALTMEKKGRLRDLCKKGYREVAGGQCCPKHHRVLIGDSCYSHCDDGFDDMVLGTWVGCRQQCEPGSSSTLTQCSRGPLLTSRTDSSRSGVNPVPQIRLKPTSPDASPSDLDEKYLPRFCRRDYVTVARRRDDSGGCCPSDAPLYIAGKCYAACEQGFEDIVIGSFVGCRKNCPDGWDQSANFCKKSGEEDVERGDFPREGIPPSDRRLRGRPAPPKNPKVTCPTGYVSVTNSDSLCCPWDHSELIGALCYEECPPSYVSTGFGCRRHCPRSAGWKTYPLTCTNWKRNPAKTVLRKGWERSPVTPKQALSTNTGSSASGSSSSSSSSSSTPAANAGAASSAPGAF